ncbi:MAG TPA: rhomboid family intramembrane serine protease [Anaerolineales bacterium]|nr:rhomboid family intramembrane serine protease [Anaerolineales bacterium]
MFPLYDTVRSHKFPIINLTLIAVNVLAFLYEIRMDEATLQGFIFTWGLIPSQFISDPSSTWVNILSSMFLHGGWFHIINNMWVLFIFGDNIEGRMGSIRYLIFYLLGGAAAGLLQTYILPSSDTPMIGASGAVAGVLGAYLVLFPRSRIASLVPILFIFTLIEIPAFLFLLFWFFSQLYSGLFAIEGGGGSGIAWWAHIGGFIFGVVMVSFFAMRRRAGYNSWQ